MTDDVHAASPVIRALPKVALHEHLDGGLRPESIIELAAPLGIELPATEPAALATWFQSSSDSGTLVEYLKTFDVTCAVMQTQEGLARVARESILDLAADGVIHAELRWAPEQHVARGLSLDETVEAVQEGIQEGIAQMAAAGHLISAGQLVTAMRHTDRSREIAELAVRHRDRGVVGFDIAGPEKGFPPSRHVEAFDYLRAQFFPTTVHAGEADGIESVASALLDGNALRLGHGVRVAEDIRIDPSSGAIALGPVATWVLDRQIPLEICPSSNLQTEAISAWGEALADHPIDLLHRLGFRVTVNCDNRLMSRTSISRELELLVETFGYGLAELEEFELNAAEATFLPNGLREELAERVLAGFAAARA